MKDSWVDPGPNMIRDGRGRGKTPEFPGRVGERVTTRTEDWWCDHPLTDGSTTSLLQDSSLPPTCSSWSHSYPLQTRVPPPYGVPLTVPTSDTPECPGESSPLSTNRTLVLPLDGRTQTCREGPWLPVPRTTPFRSTSSPESFLEAPLSVLSSFLRLGS